MRDSGIFDLNSWEVLEVKGPDAQDFLHRMIAADVKTLKRDQMVHAAILTGKAGVVGLGWLRAISEGYQFFFSEGQVERVQTHFEQFHFAESVTFHRSNDTGLYGLWNPSSACLAALSIPADLPPLTLHSIQWEGTAWRDDDRKGLFWLTLPRTSAVALMEWAQSHSLSLLEPPLFDYFRAEAGVPHVGKEIQPSDLILETGRGQSVSREKGCYPGQEVVERIYTYGGVNRKLLKIQFSLQASMKLPSLPCSLFSDECEAGTLVSCYPSPDSQNTAIGMAYIKKEHWESQKSFTDPDGLVAGTLQ